MLAAYQALALSARVDVASLQFYKALIGKARASGYSSVMFQSRLPYGRLEIPASFRRFMIQLVRIEFSEIGHARAAWFFDVDERYARLSAVGERFGVSAASVSRWRNLHLRQGDARPGPLGGDRNSRKTEAHAIEIMAWLTGNHDGTLFELRDALSAQDIMISKSALHRFLVRRGQTRKKDWPRDRAEPPRSLGAAPALVRRSTGP